MLKRSLTEDAQEVFRAIALIELGARMQTLDRPAVAVALTAAEFGRARDALLANIADRTAPVD